MKGSLGNPARGDAFFKRDGIIKRIYSVLDTDASIYLSAPRRVGKTSILKNIEDFPEENYCFIYIITESVDSPNDFFKTIFEELIKSDAINKLAKIGNVATTAMSSLVGKIKSISDVELRENKESDYYLLLINLFAQINVQKGNIVLMIDEFPQTIQNILNKDGEKEAEKFIQKNRQLRHHENVLDKVRFIYTGSLSLFPIVEKVTSLTAINDLYPIVVDPLGSDEAKEFLQALLSYHNLIADDLVLEYVVIKMRWLIPFHLQLLKNEIYFLVSDKELDGNLIKETSVVDVAFDNVVDARNEHQFKPYFQRLKTLFIDKEYDFVFEVLTHIAINDTINHSELTDIGVKHKLSDIKRILNILDSDGYIYKVGNEYRYTSPILQLWCRKHIC